MQYNDIIELLKVADLFANNQSGCLKVKVGSVIIKEKVILSFGANRTFPSVCMTKGCLRKQKWGNASKSHRKPEDCRALHSEIDAICNAKESLEGTSIIITRYPCEACARAIAAAGITNVYYGRKQLISSDTEDIFDYADVTVMHINWDKEDVYE